MDRHLTRVGVTAGLIGGTVVAAWFLVVDTVAGHAFSTPAALGNSMLDTFEMMVGRSAATSVLVYTVAHYVTFVLAGIVAAHAVHAMRSNPTLTMAFEMLLVVVLIVISLFSLTLSQSPMFAPIAWYEIWLANVFAAIAMGWFIKSRVAGRAAAQVEARL